LSEPVISVRGLRKSYGEVEAVRGIDLELRRGEVLAFLGPNGAGKTTTVEILEGYRRRSGGEISVLGEDPEHAGRAWRERIGIVLQSGRPDPYLTVRESLALYAGYYRAPRPIDEVVELVGLGAKADARASSLSGGQQRRLDVGLALIGDPELLFLDEPTTGFDPSARRQAWETIAGLRDLGKTVFLTTHYMDEAQRLADRVAILARGEVVALGTPEDLGDRESRPARISYREDGREVELQTTDPVQILNELTGRALAEGQRLEGLEVTRPSLEDVYLELTDQA
jgi:ABC-2 type transport system ATP-binding protein